MKTLKQMIHENQDIDLLSEPDVIRTVKKWLQQKRQEYPTDENWKFHIEELIEELQE